MNRTEFMDRLAKALCDMPEEERRQAMEYYKNYFDEVSSEQEVLDTLGAPEGVAADVLRDFQNTAEAQKLQKFRKRRRNCVLAGIVAVSIVCICIFGVHTVISDEYELSEDRGLTVEQEIRSLTVEAQSASVVIQFGDSWHLDAGKSTTWEKDQYSMAIRQVNQTGLFRRKPGNIILTVPYGEVNEMNLYVGAGRLEMQHMTVPEIITCRVENGAAYLEDVNTKTLTLSVEDGKIVWDGNVYQSATVNCDTGSIDVSLGENSEIGCIAGRAGDGTVTAQVNGKSFLENINLANGFSYTLQWMERTGQLDLECNTGKIFIKLKSTAEAPYP